MLLELGPQLSQYPPDDGVLRSAEYAKTVQLIGKTNSWCVYIKAFVLPIGVALIQIIYRTVTLNNKWAVV